MSLLRQKCIVGRKIQDTCYGSVLQCKLLHGVEDATMMNFSLSKADAMYAEGEIVAVKVMDGEAMKKRVDRRTGLKTSEDPLKEIEALRELTGIKNVIRLIDNFDDLDREKQLLVIIIEYCEMELFQVVKECDPEGIEPILLRSIVSGLFQGLDAIFRAGFVHRDISVENLLLRNGVLKICDFGLSIRWPQHLQSSQMSIGGTGGAASASASSSSSSSSFMSMDLDEIDDDGGRSTENIFERVGKLGYMSPELLACTIQDWRQSDIYSAGVALFITFCGFPPCDVAHEADTSGGYMYLKSGRIKELLTRFIAMHRVPPELFQLLEGVLRVDPRKRINIFQIIDYLEMAGWKT